MGFKILKAGHVVVGTRDLACRILVRPSIQRPRCCVIGEAGGVWGGGRPGRPRGPKRVVLSNRLRIGNCLSQTVTYWCADLRRGIFSGVAGLRVSLSLCHGSAWLTRRSPGDAGGASLHQVSTGSEGATLRTPERLRSPTQTPTHFFCREAGTDCELV